MSIYTNSFLEGGPRGAPAPIALAWLLAQEPWIAPIPASLKQMTNR